MAKTSSSGACLGSGVEPAPA